MVMPVHDAEAHLGEALATLHAQDWPELELVAVDDGSTDGSAKLLAEAEAAWSGPGRSMRVIRQQNRGAAAARNAGIAACSGDWVLLADADDRCDPGLVRAGMAARGEADLVFARCRFIDGAGAVQAVQAELPGRIGVRELLDGVMVNTPLVRRAAGEAVGWHDEGLEGSVDLDLFVRLALRREDCLRALPEVLSDYRRTGGQITSDWRRMERTWSRVRDKALAAGYAPGTRALSRMRGRHCAYWATLAYLAGDYGAARRLIAEAARRDPGYVARDEMARVRALACAASLLPEGWHQRLRARVNARRAS